MNGGFGFPNTDLRFPEVLVWKRAGWRCGKFSAPPGGHGLPASAFTPSWTFLLCPPSLLDTVAVLSVQMHWNLSDSLLPAALVSNSAPSGAQRCLETTTACQR